MTRWCFGLVLLLASVGCAGPSSAAYQRASARSSFNVRIIVDAPEAAPRHAVAHNPYVRPPESPYLEPSRTAAYNPVAHNPYVRPPESPYLRETQPPPSPY